MIRLRVSSLDQWVGFVEPEREEYEVSVAQFIAQLRREAPPNEAMLAGTAFHAVMERLREGEQVDAAEGVEQDGFRFRFDDDYDLYLPPVREHETPERVFHTPSGPVSLQGRIDAERYGGSLQWRAYLLLTGARRFRYLAFENKRRGADVWIHAVHELDFWAYPEMGAEVERRVRELAEFVARWVPELATEPQLEGAVT
jgi:hypothetical protein